MMRYTTLVLFLMLKDAKNKNDKKKIQSIMKFIESQCDKI